LRESTVELCRNLKGNPNIAENLSKIQTERSNMQNLLSKTLRELRENSFSTLTATVEVRFCPGCAMSARTLVVFLRLGGARRCRRRRRAPT
jgi:hypothetical protein